MSNGDDFNVIYELSGENSDYPMAKRASHLILLSPLALLLMIWSYSQSYCEGESLGRPKPTSNASASVSPAVKPQRCYVHHNPQGWTFMSPDGAPFFSLGVCVVDRGTAQDRYSSDKPSYAAWRHFSTSTAWADNSLTRLKQWGFTTVGGWSDYDSLAQSKEHSLWLTPVLHLGSMAGAPWLDMWDEGHIRRMRDVAEKTILPLRDDPRVIGYFSDNEIGWWNAILWRMTFEQPAASEQRRRLIGLVREHYADDFGAVSRDFDTQGAADWRQLEQGGSLVYKPGKNGLIVMRRFLEAMAERYYQLMSEIIERYDPDALYLGDRYQSFYYPEVASASSRYVDVVSTNLNAHWNDGTFLRCYLDTLHELTEKPVLVSEFYMAAMENRSNNPNSSSQFPVVASQLDRAKAINRSLDALLRLRYVVGADWFQYYDEPPHGRYDGEDYNFGLVDIENRPYDEITAVFAKQRNGRHQVEGDQTAADASLGIPAANVDPFANFSTGEALRQWDRERGFVTPVSRFPMADLYVCWTPKAVYLGLYAIDVVESDLYGTAQVPESDRALWTVQVGQRKAITARIGGGLPPEVDGPKVRMETLSGLDHDARLIAIMEVPATECGVSEFRAHDAIQLTSSLVTQNRGCPVNWQGEYALSE